MRNYLRVFIWLLIILFLWWAVKDIPFRDILQTLENLTAPQILLLFSVNAALMMFLGARWWLILRVQGYPIPYLTLSAYRLAAFSVAYFTPGPHFGGEPWQIFLPQQRHGVPGTVSLASLGLDKLLDLLANFTFLIIGVLILLGGGLLEGELGITIVILSLLLLAAPLGYLLWLWRGGAPLSGAITRLAAWHRAPAWAGRTALVIREAESLASSFGRRYPLTFILCVVISGMIWVGLILEFWLALSYLGLDLSLAQTISVITAARIANLFPSPGALGTLEASQVLVMQTLGLNPALGLGLSLLIRARDLSFGGIGLAIAWYFSPTFKFSTIEGD